MFLSSLNISASGMTAQRIRLDIAAENISNIETTRTADGTPYRKKMVVFEAEQSDFKTILDTEMSTDSPGGVFVSEIIEDDSDLPAVYDPEHPDADEDGYVYLPNVDLIKETADAMAATRSYEANITAYNALKQMIEKALEIGK